MDHGYTLHHRPRDDGRRGGGVGVLVNSKLKLSTRQVSVNENVSSFESMELVLTISSVTIRLVTIYRMPRSKGNGDQVTFCDELSNYMEKLSCASGIIVMAGDFNVDWLNKDGLERKQLYCIFETYGFVQNIDVATSKHLHLLDYIITRKDCDYTSNFEVSDFISDHRALHLSLRCLRSHPARKRIQVRALRRIRGDVLDADLASFIVDRECDDVNVVVTQYDDFLSKLLDKHAPLKEIDVVERQLNDWMTDDILLLKKNRRKKELIWRKHPITINFDIYIASCEAVKNAIDSSKAELLQRKIIDCNGNQKKMFKIIDSLLGRKKQQVLPEYSCALSLASMINTFFLDKISLIRADFPLLEPTLKHYSFDSIDSILPHCTTIFDHFVPLTSVELLKIISVMNKTTCVSDPFPTKLLISHVSSIIGVILHIVNLSLTSGVFPLSCKSSVIVPLIKKPGLDAEILKNYRPVANLTFLSKVIEKVIALQIYEHLSNNDIVDSFQSAYKAGHSCETALLRVYNDITTTIGKGNGKMLVLLDLSAAFDTIDHVILFDILVNYVGLRGKALDLIKSYFLDRTQRVQIDGVLCEFAKIVCGVPQGSVLRPLKFCLYMLPLSAILRFHKIGYHVYAHDDTQIYVSFKCDDPLQALGKINVCISDIRRWMILNKLKINDAKTEFIIFRSPQMRHDLNGLSVNVGDSQIVPSVKVRNLGVIFDQSLTFDDHISAICQSVHFHIRSIGKVRKLLSFDACAILIHALISSRLDYCNSILYNLPDTKIGRLQRVQNQAARILTRSPRREHITPVLKQLHWLKVRERIRYKILILTHKAFYANAPPYLCSLVVKRESVVSTRSSQDGYLLCKPPLSRDCSNTFLERSFLYAAPHEWNSLEKGVRISEFNAFKKAIKTVLFIQCYPGLN